MEMAFRAEKRIGAFLSCSLLGPALLAQPSLQYEVWHGHFRPPHIRKAGNMGMLTVSDTGVSFEEKYQSGKTPKHPHTWHWDYQDIQQLKIASKSLTVLTYKDNKWKLGADREYEFDLVSENTFQDVYPVLKNRLDQRFVAALTERPTDTLWEIPVKLLHRFSGDEGVLRVGTDAIVYSSEKKDASRTWRYEDIDNVSSAGPFELTITTYEGAELDYGDRKQFNFQLKAKVEEDRFNDLWLRLNQSKGLKILTAYRDGSAER
jgi:hypothetical protein